MRFFNTAGPCDPARHCMIPAAPIHKRTRFLKARTPKRYAVTLLRA